MDKLSPQMKAEISNTFAILDVDGSGLLTARELRAMMRVFGYENSEEDVQRMIDAVDTDGSGKMNFTKFCAALCWKEKPEEQVELDDGKMSKTDDDEPAVGQ